MWYFWIWIYVDKLVILLPWDWLGNKEIKYNKYLNKTEILEI